MLLNEDLRKEVKEAVNACGITKVELAKRMGVSDPRIHRILAREYELGKWVDLLDLCGYDVEITIKKKKKS